MTFVVFGVISVSMIFLFPFGFIGMIFFFLGFRKPAAKVMYLIAQGWARMVIAVTRCKVFVTGRENIPKKGGVCFVGNHCGYFDIVLLLAYCGRPIGFIAKKELLLVPFLNFWIYVLGGQFIDRSSTRKAVRSIKKGVNRIMSGGGMIIFPEGHRSKGRGLLPFHPGSLKLATMAGAPIIPVTLKGSYELFEKHNRYNLTDFYVNFGEIIDTKSLPAEEKKVALSDRIYKIIDERLSKLPDYIPHAG